LERSPDGDFYVRTGPGSVRLAPDSAREYIRTRFSARG
jgi:type I restriction enzyme, R subunit